MTIEAMKQMAELLAVATFHSPELQEKRTTVLNAGLKAIEQAEKQEPVAGDDEMKAQAKRAYPHDEKRELAFIDGWLSCEVTFQNKPVAIDWGAVHEKLIEVWHREMSADEGLHEIQGLIDTSPPQRQWVGLTDEEVEQIRDDMTLDIRSHVDFYRHCEAKLKEKNT